MLLRPWLWNFGWHYVLSFQWITAICSIPEKEKKYSRNVPLQGFEIRLFTNEHICQQNSHFKCFNSDCWSFLTAAVVETSFGFRHMISMLTCISLIMQWSSSGTSLSFRRGDSTNSSPSKVRQGKAERNVMA